MQRQSACPKYTAEEVWPIYQAYVSESVLQGMLTSLTRRYYQRVFTLLLIVWGFLYQRLQADHTCDGYVSYLTSSPIGQQLHPGKGLSENTGAYCQARTRLPVGVARGVLRHTARRLSEQYAWEGAWLGRATYLLDGSTLQLAASAELLSYYGTPVNQHGASHWPVLRMVVAFHLWNGAVAAAAEGSYDRTELSLGLEVLRDLLPGGVVVADQYYGLFQVLQTMRHYHLDGVIRMQHSHVQRWTQEVPFRHGRDQLVTWFPSPTDQLRCGMSPEPLQGRLLSALCQRDGYRPLKLYLFTTLTDQQAYPFQAILDLYGRRWCVELDLRHVKTTLDMETLSAKSLAMVRKEFFLGLTAYNLLRALMAAAALRAGRSPLTLRLASCLRRFRDSALCSCAIWIAPHRQTEADLLLVDVLDRMATCRLPIRAHPRFEPRRVWPRPTSFKFIRGSRQLARLAALAARANS